MENRTEKKTVSTVDMTTEVFKAMSQGISNALAFMLSLSFLSLCVLLLLPLTALLTPGRCF